MSESGVYEGGGQPGIFQGNPSTDQIITGTNADTGQFEYLTSPNEYANYVNQERTAGRDAYNYNTAQYSGYLADQRQLADDNFRRSPAGEEWQRQQDLGTARKAQRDSKGTFNIIAGIVAAVAVVLTAGTALGFFGPALAAAEGAAIGAGAGGLEGAVAAAVAEGAIEAGVATAALAEAAPAVAAIETGVSAAAGGAAGAAEVAAPSIFSSIIDGATSVYNAISGVVESVGAFTDISSPLTIAAKDAGINPLAAKLGSTALVGAGRGSLTSALTGSDPGLGALGGAVGSLVGYGSKELLTAAGLGKEGIEAGLKGTLSSALGSGASGAARAAASGGDIGGAALRGLATGGASGAANYLLSDALGLGNTVGSLGGSVASTLVGQALAPDAPDRTRTSSRVRTPQTVVVRVPYPTTSTNSQPASSSLGTPSRRTSATSAPTNTSTGGALSSSGLSALLSSSGGRGEFSGSDSFSDAGNFSNTGGSTSDRSSPSSSGSLSSPSSSSGSNLLSNVLNSNSGVINNSGNYGGGVYNTGGISGGTVGSSTPSTLSTSTLASLLSSPSDPGYSSPIDGNSDESQYADNTEPSTSQPSPWNRSSLRRTDPLGSYYG